MTTSRFCKSQVFNLKTDIPIDDRDISLVLKTSDQEIAQNKDDIFRLFKEALGESISTIKLLENKGTFHLLFEIKGLSGNTYILKIFKSILPLHAHHFFTEQWIMHNLKLDTHISAKIYALDSSRKHFPFDYLIMEKIKGNSLHSFKNNDDLLNKYITKLGRLLAYVHQIPAEGCGLIDCLKLEKYNTCFGYHKFWTQYIFLNLEQHLEYCYKNQIFSLKDYKNIYYLFCEYESLFHYNTPKLLHGDLGSQNIYVVNNELLVVDWEDALCGDPVFDIASWGTFVGHHDKLKFLLQGYKQRGKLPADFELKYWLYYLRIIIAKTVLRYRYKYNETDSIPAIDRILFPLKSICQLTI